MFPAQRAGLFNERDAHAGNAGLAGTQVLPAVRRMTGSICLFSRTSRQYLLSKLAPKLLGKLFVIRFVLFECFLGECSSNQMDSNESLPPQLYGANILNVY